jgi:hypothetical protein
VAGRTDRAGDEALVADRLTGDLGGAPVDLERVLGQAPLVELEAAGLEGVGLDDLGAGLDHRRVDALDDVGPVEDQRLVALAGKAAVVLGGQVELLQGGAHAAVEDDDAAADCLEVVAHAAANANSDSANLDKLVTTFGRRRTAHAMGRWRDAARGRRHAQARPGVGVWSRSQGSHAPPERGELESASAPLLRPWTKVVGRPDRPGSGSRDDEGPARAGPSNINQQRPVRGGAT